MTDAEIFSKIIDARANHSKFLDSTEKNLAFYLFGRDVPIVKKNTYPSLNLLDAISGYQANPMNPLAYLVESIAQEIANSEFYIEVSPYPVGDREPYASFANQLETYLYRVHERAKRSKYIKACIIEILAQAYFGIYTNGQTYSFLSPYDLIPGDFSVSSWQDQPFITRRTSHRRIGIERFMAAHRLLMSIELIEELKNYGPLDYVLLYDTWIKDLDQNIVQTENGARIYSQSFPHPKIYPFFIAADSDILGSLVTLPKISKLRDLVTEYKDAEANIAASAKTIANPILTYDKESGIKADVLLRSIRQGYKHIIVGKYRDGDINFKAPGHIPPYAQHRPAQIESVMRSHLGISEFFVGNAQAGIREKGAISRLFSTSFRLLLDKVSMLKDMFSDLDFYLLEYFKSHRLTFKLQESPFKNIEEIWQGGVTYIPREKFKGFESDDSNWDRQFALSKWRTGLIHQKLALRELKYDNPEQIIEEMAEEKKRMAESQLQIQQMTQVPVPSLMDKIVSKLLPSLEGKFWVIPLKDKAIIRCRIENRDRIAFLLSDLAAQVLIEIVPQKEKLETAPPTPTPEEKVEAEKEPVAPEEEKPAEEIPEKGLVTPPEKVGPGMERERGRPRKSTSEIPAAHKSSPVLAFSEQYLEDLVSRSKKIREPKKYLNLSGLYLVEPHAGDIHEGRKLLTLKAKKFDIVDQPMLLCGDKVYGVIIMRRVVECDRDLYEKTQKYHLVTPNELAKWWKIDPTKEFIKPLYLYMFEYHPFDAPLDYEKVPGVQTFMRDVKVKGSLGLPYRGDLKPVLIKPWIIPESHKPEKKALQSQEVFSLERLKAIIPEGTYDISSKLDGLRTFCWIVDGKARMFSDERNEFPESRVKPLLAEAVKMFRHNVLLDGELIMKGIERKDIAGYIHGKFDPTPEQLNSLRYIAWDVLYVKDQPIANKPFRVRSEVLDLYLPYRKIQTRLIQRVYHIVGTQAEIPALTKKVSSREGVVIRDIEAAYWATHGTFKMKYQAELDVKVIGVEKTKVGTPIYFCTTREGVYIGQTYASLEVVAKVGDVIRVMIDHITLKPDGSLGWFSPKIQSLKGPVKFPEKGIIQPGVGGADTMALVKELYLARGGSESQWNSWLPSFEVWKKNVMPKLVESLIRKAKAGVEPAKT